MLDVYEITVMYTGVTKRKLKTPELRLMSTYALGEEHLLGHHHLFSRHQYHDILPIVTFSEGKYTPVAGKAASRPENRALCFPV